MMNVTGIMEKVMVAGEIQKRSNQLPLLEKDLASIQH